MELSYFCGENDVNKTIKTVLKEQFKLSTRLLNKLKMMQKISINQDIAMVNNAVKEGDRIVVSFDYDEEDGVIPQDGKIDILYEDDWYLAVSKKAHLCVHPSSFHPDNTLANYVKYYLNNRKKIRPVNRLDNGTSGICVFAKNEYAQEMFNYYRDEIVKEYLAIVEGVFEEKEGVINAPISRKENSIIERHVDIENGQRAITHYKVEKEIMIEEKRCSIIKVWLETGRTHQIRVHMAYLGHPILGDSLYGEKSQVIDRQALHALKLSFLHPILKQKITIESPLENDILLLTN